MGTAQSVEIRKVLLLEDERDIAESVSMLLDYMWKINCQSFPRPERELLAVLDVDHVCDDFCKSFDGVITDLEMPGMNGDVFLRKLFASKCCLKHLPIVLATAMYPGLYLNDFCRRHAVTLVPKPFAGGAASLYNGLAESRQRLADRSYSY